MRFDDGVKVVNIATITRNEEDSTNENAENKEVETNVEE